jgi:uncharacterized protein (TIGR02117 family)
MGLGAIAVLVAAIATARSGDRSLYPAPSGTPVVEAFVVSNGYHSGIAIPRAALGEVARRDARAALTMIATRFAGYSWVELGFGEEAFYRGVPSVGSIDLALALRALFRPHNPSVIQVTGVLLDPPAAFPLADTVRIELSEAGFARMAQRLNASFAPTPSGLPADDLGPGLYGSSLFFRATGWFDVFNLCNHWVADLLDAAGVPTTPVLDTLAQGLFVDLRWRSGLAPI